MGSDRSDDGVPQEVAVRDPAFAQMEAEIAETRQRVARAVTALEVEITRAVDWREWIRRYPARALGAAFTVGWLIGRRS